MKRNTGIIAAMLLNSSSIFSLYAAALSISARELEATRKVIMSLDQHMIDSTGKVIDLTLAFAVLDNCTLDPECNAQSKAEIASLRKLAEFIATIRDYWALPTFILEGSYAGMLDKLRTISPDALKVLARQLTLPFQIPEKQLYEYSPMIELNTQSPLGGMLGKIVRDFTDPQKKALLSSSEFNRRLILQKLIFVNFLVERYPQFFSPVEMVNLNNVTVLCFETLPAIKNEALKNGVKFWTVPPMSNEEALPGGARSMHMIAQESKD